MAGSSTLNKTQETSLSRLVLPEQEGQRLDLFLAFTCSPLLASRSRVQSLIRKGLVTVNGEEKKAGYTVQAGDAVQICVPPPEPVAVEPEAVHFDPIYEDDDIVVLAKPPGIVVHPGSGHGRGTLVHGLLYHCDSLSGISGELRPGIVHRLDKDTSGVMVVAKNDSAHSFLAGLFKSREVRKVYRAIIDGRLPRDRGRVEMAIGRHPVHRKKMAVRHDSGREAVTNWQVLEVFSAGYSFVELRPETGRTHQIRVHMAYAGCPIAGDEMYGRKKVTWERFGISRQCLHAYSLTFPHPRSGETMHFVAPLWNDMEESLARLRFDEKQRLAAGKH